MYDSLYYKATASNYSLKHAGFTPSNRSRPVRPGGKRTAPASMRTVSWHHTLFCAVQLRW